MSTASSASTVNTAMLPTGNLLSIIRSMPFEDFEDLEKRFSMTYSEIPSGLEDRLSAIAHRDGRAVLPKVPEIHQIVQEEPEMSYLELTEHMECLANDKPFRLVVKWVDEFEPMEAFKVKFEGYQSSIVTMEDFDFPCQYREVCDQLIELARSCVTGGHAGITKGCKSASGYGLLFNKGSHEEGRLRSLLTERSAFELDRLMNLPAQVRKSAVLDIAGMEPGKRGAPYTFSYDKKNDLAVLHLEGYAISRHKLSSIANPDGKSREELSTPTLGELIKKEMTKVKSPYGLANTIWPNQKVPSLRTRERNKGRPPSHVYPERLEGLSNRFEVLTLEASTSRELRRVNSPLSKSGRGLFGLCLDPKD